MTGRKTQSIIPIPKYHYRPISLLPVIAKILEKTLHCRSHYYLDSNDFFTECQGGFRPNMGVNQTIDNMLDYI